MADGTEFGRISRGARAALGPAAATLHGGPRSADGAAVQRRIFAPPTALPAPGKRDHPVFRVVRLHRDGAMDQPQPGHADLYPLAGTQGLAAAARCSRIEGRPDAALSGAVAIQGCGARLSRPIGRCDMAKAIHAPWAPADARRRCPRTAGRPADRAGQRRVPLRKVGPDGRRTPPLKSGKDEHITAQAGVPSACDAHAPPLAAKGLTTPPTNAGKSNGPHQRRHVGTQGDNASYYGYYGQSADWPECVARKFAMH